MCRITGIIDKGSSQLNTDLVAMRDAMHRGGPDHAGIYENATAHLTLGHRRLSIIDLCETGNQPMFNEDRKLALIFNGEIYNFQELKAELKKSGYHFTSSSDTEVILKCYEQWGTGCFKKFRGMFAIALYDVDKEIVVLARDHAGIKPLYYFCDGKSLYFASEIRAFKKLGRKWEENPYWKVYFLTYGYLPASITTLKGVKPIEKGSYLIFDINTLESKHFFFYKDDFTEQIKNGKEAREVIREALNESVKRHLIADAPIGLFLSGGIDSSLLTILAKNYKKDLHTLSIIFDDKTYSEKKYQDIIANKVQSKHQSFLLTKDIFTQALPDIMEAMDQPSSDGINSYFISKFAKEAGLKAVLSGLGADEFFGGYSSFKRGTLVKNLNKLPHFFYQLAKTLPQDKYKKFHFLTLNNITGEYLFNRGYFIPSDTAQILDMKEQQVINLLQEIEVPECVSTLSEGNKASYLESNLYMESQLLKDTDVMSMWHSIEVRVPFLDFDLIKKIQGISSQLKFSNPQSKFLLIDSFKDLLPQEIWNRPKQGFVFPFDNWMKESVGEWKEINRNLKIEERFKSGRLSWSRYWTYLVSQSFQA